MAAAAGRPQSCLVRLGVGGGFFLFSFSSLLLFLSLSHLYLLSFSLTSSHFLLVSYISACFSFPLSVRLILSLTRPPLSDTSAGSHLQHVPAPVDTIITIFKAALYFSTVCVARNDMSYLLCDDGVFFSLCFSG